jgi:3-oxoacyl-[acyl-carrier protein] reductase
MTVESFNKQFNLNVLGVMLCCREAVKLFGAAGGAIVNIGSAVSTLAPINSTVYSASKGGVELITKVLSKELGPRKIRVNSVNPGAIHTPGSTNLEGGGDFFETIQTITPLGRIGEPTDIAPAVAYLASDDALFVTGEIITVSGGIK